MIIEKTTQNSTPIAGPQAAIVVSLVFAIVITGGGTAISLPAAVGQILGAMSDEVAAREKEAQKVYRRFLSVLQQRPRFGTALDRVYAFHIEQSSLETFLAELRDTANTAPTDGDAWMLLGVCELRGGHYSEAESALARAEALLPQHATVSWYRARALRALGQNDSAIAAFERALTRGPERMDLLDISMELGRTLQQMQKTDQALSVWKQLEEQFPNDLRVAERIATELAAEGRTEEALVRFESLAERTPDRFQSVQFAVRAAELKNAAGRAIEARSDLESLLGKLRPRSWLFDDIRKRIEQIVQTSGEPNAVVNYYTQWLQSHPEDQEARLRLADEHSRAGHDSEATEMLTSAVRRAPTDVYVRRALIRHLVRTNDIRAALAQHNELAKIDPGNRDQLEDWGLLHLRDESISETERQQRASVVWNQLLLGRENDAVTVRHVADLFRRGGMSEHALVHYRRAVELRPDDMQYREDLGEYLHSLKRTDEAVTVWAGIADGERQTTANLVRLASIYQHAELPELALRAMREACGTDPAIADRLTYARMLTEAKRFDDALQQLEMAESTILPQITNLLTSATSNSADRRRLETDLDAIQTDRVQTLAAARRLETFTVELTKVLASKVAPSQSIPPHEAYSAARQWSLLAMCQKSLGNVVGASDSVARSLTLAPNSIGLWTTAAELAEQRRSPADAIDAYRKLAELDPPTKTQQLKKIAVIQQREELNDEAIETTLELLTAAPGNPEHYRFLAELYQNVGRTDDALDALRRAIRIDPTDTSLRMSLAGTLADDFRTAEAIDVLWQVFELTGMDTSASSRTDLPLPDWNPHSGAAMNADRESVVRQLTDLSLRTARFDQLIERLTPLSADSARDRTMALARSTAHHAAGDLHAAHDALRTLVEGEISDPDLLKQLLVLAQQSNDLDNAIVHARRLFEISPTEVHRNRLSDLLTFAADADELEALWLADSQPGTEPFQLIGVIDALIELQRYEVAAELCQRMTARNPQNWESLFRSGVIRWRQGDREKASEFFRAVFELELPESSPSAAAEKRDTANSAVIPQPNSVAVLSANADLENVSAGEGPTAAIREWNSVWPPAETVTFGASSQDKVNSIAIRLNNSPQDFSSLSELKRTGVAKQAAMSLLFRHHREAGTLKNLSDWFVGRFRDVKDSNLLRVGYFLSAASIEDEWGDHWNAYSGIVDLVSTFPQPEAKWLYLRFVDIRTSDAEAFSYISKSDSEINGCDAVFDQHEIDAFRIAVQDLMRDHPNLFSNGDFGGLNPGRCATFIRSPGQRNPFLEELRRTGQESDSDESISVALQFAQLLNEPAIAELLFRRKWAIAEDTLKSRNRKANWQQEDSSMLRWIVADLAAANQWERILNLLDALLAPDRYQTTSTHHTVNSVSILGEAASQLRSVSEELFWESGAIPVFAAANRLDDLRAWHARLKTAHGGVDSRFLSGIQSGIESADGNQKFLIRSQIQLAASSPGNRTALAQVAGFIGANGYAESAIAIFDQLWDDSTEHELSEEEILSVEVGALNAALSGGLSRRAVTAAERLVSVGISRSSLLEDHPQLELMGFTAPTPSVKTQQTRRRSDDRMAELVARLEQPETPESAAVHSEVAYEILRRSGGLPQPLVQPGSNSTDFSEHRELALKAIKGTRLLQSLITRAEQLVSTTSDPGTLLELLTEYYEVNADTDRQQEVMRRYAELTKESPPRLLERAAELERVGKTSDACDLLLKCLVLAPEQFADDFETHWQTFDHAKRTPDLAKALLKIGLKELPLNPDSLINLAVELKKLPETQQLSRTLIEETLARFSDFEMITERLAETQLLSREELARLIVRDMIPLPNDDPCAVIWKGADSSRISILFRQLTTSQEHDSLLEVLDEAIEQNQSWKFGLVLRMLIQAHRGDFTVVSKQLTQQLSDPDLQWPPPVALCVAEILAEIPGDYSAWQISLASDAYDRAHGRRDGLRDGARTLLIDFLHAMNQRNRIRILRLDQRHESGLFSFNFEPVPLPSVVQVEPSEEAADGPPLLPVDLLRAISQGLMTLRTMDHDDAVSTRQKVVEHTEAALRSFDAAQVTDWLQDCLDRPDDLPADELYDLLPVVEPFQIDGPIIPEELPALRQRSLLLTAIHGARYAEADHKKVLSVIHRVLAAEQPDSRILMMCVACPLVAEDRELQTELLNRLQTQLEREDTAAAANTSQRKSGVLNYAIILRDVSFCTLAGILAGKPETQHLVEPFLRRAANAARAWGDEWLFVGTLNSCEETARAAGLNSFADELAAESAEIKRIRIERRDLPGFDVDREVRDRLLKMP